jgi:hypothetical protein
VSKHTLFQGAYSGLPGESRARANCNGEPTAPAGQSAAQIEPAVTNAVTRVLQGIGDALRSRYGVFVVATTTVFALDVLVPPAVLSIARKPFDYFTFNPWLPLLPAYLFGSEVPLQRKIEFLPNMALFWFSADSPYGGVDWGFAVTLSDLLRFLLLSLLFGLYFALVFHYRDQSGTAGWSSRLSREGGASGALASVLGISTGGCTVMGCGAPVIPVVGLAFAGLSSGTLVLLAELSRVSTTIVFIAVTLGVIYLGWRAGDRPMRSRESRSSNDAMAKERATL